VRRTAALLATLGCSTLNPPEPAPRCDVAKLRFERESACRFDLGHEACVTRVEATVLASLRKIAPDLDCQPATFGGRAGCVTGEHYCTWSPPGCVNAEAPPDAAWDAACRMSTLPEVRAIAPIVLE
jgi:hypothetical protein